MKALLVADWLGLRRVLPLYGLYGLIFIGGLGWMEDGISLSFATVVSSLGICLMVLLQSFKAEEKGGELFLASLPLRPADRLHAKLILMAWAGAFGFIATALLGLLASLPPLRLRLGGLGPLDALRVLSGILALSAILPLWFRFGIQAVRIGTFVGLALGVVLQVGLMARLGDGGKPLLLVLLDRFTALDLLTRNLGILAASLLVAGVSYVASRAVLARREG